MLKSTDLFSKSVAAQAVEYTVGERVWRRDSGQDWGTGYVTSNYPLRVTTVSGDPKALGVPWDACGNVSHSQVFGDSVHRWQRPQLTRLLLVWTSNELAPSACHEFLGVEFCSQQGAHPERQVTIVATLRLHLSICFHLNRR